MVSSCPSRATDAKPSTGLRNASGDPPPIAELLQKKPWLLANLYSGRIPHGGG